VKEVTIQVLVDVYDHLVATKPAQLSRQFNDMYPSANTPAVDPSTTPATPPTGTPTSGRQRNRGKGKRENGQPASGEAGLRGVDSESRRSSKELSSSGDVHDEP
jgi:hypothetical protein